MGSLLLPALLAVYLSSINEQGWKGIQWPGYLPADLKAEHRAGVIA